MGETFTERVLVTGATGFLARHLLPWLPSGLALVRTKASWAAVPASRSLATPVFGTLETVADWSGQIGRLRAIVHLAALVRHSRKNADDVYRTNVDGTLAMVRLAAEVGARLIFVSTSGTVSCFKTPDQLADEEAPYCEAVISRWPYYDSKMRAERAARALAAQLGVDLVIVRLPVILGPGDHRGRSTSLLWHVAQGRQRFVTNGTIAFTDVRDAARGIATILTLPKARPIYHLSGTNWRLPVFCQLCADLAGARPPRWRLPGSLVLALSHMASGTSRILGVSSGLPDPVVAEMASHHWGFTSRWSHELGYAGRPERETLGDAIAWLRDQENGVHNAD